MKEYDGTSYRGRKLDGPAIYEIYKNCDFSHCGVETGVVFSGKFFNCKFNEARLIRARFSGTALFVNCDFTGADFAGAVFNSPTFESCKFDWAKFHDALHLYTTKLDALCSVLHVKGAALAYSAPRGHYLAPELKPPPAISSADDYYDEMCGWAGMGWHTARDLKAVLLVSDEAEFNNDDS